MSLYLTLFVLKTLEASPPKFCPFANVDSKCQETSKYRTHDGSCNNLENSMLGKSVTPYKRLTSNAYEDGLGTVRATSKVDQQPLPNARKVASAVHASLTPDTASTSLSHLGTMFGQFVNHDLGMAASSSSIDGKVPLKCTCGMDSNVECLNVATPVDDDSFKDQACMSLTRSGAAIDKFDCTLNAREQTNLVTHWLDLSQLYGNDANTAQGLRAKKNGLMRTSSIPGLNSRVDQLPKATAGNCVDETSDEVSVFL